MVVVHSSRLQASSAHAVAHPSPAIPARSNATAATAHAARPAAPKDGMERVSGAPVGSRPASAAELQQWVGRALLEDISASRQRDPAAVEAKLQRLETSPFVFFRGTAPLFYRELAGKDAGMPEVLCNGDVHPENFGAMPGPDGGATFGLNDFDEAHSGPFSLDVRRGAVGFELLARSLGLKGSVRKDVVEHFVKGYTRAAAGQAKDAGNPPHVVKDLLKRADGTSRKALLETLVDVKHGRFQDDEHTHRTPDLVDTVQAALNGAGGMDGKFLHVKDVARRTASGVGSMDLERLVVLLEGPSKDGKDDRVLELKAQRPSAMAKAVKQSPLDVRMGRNRIPKAEAIQAASGDTFFSTVTFHGQPFTLKERSPQLASVDTAALGKDALEDYARACGEALAAAHARSIPASKADGAGIPGVVGKDGWVDGMVKDASKAADMVEEDHARFLKLRHAGGALANVAAGSGG